MKTDFFREVLQLDSMCNDIGTVRLVQERATRAIVKRRQNEIEAILNRLSDLLDESLKKSVTFREWFEILVTRKGGACKSIFPVFVIEAFAEPTGYICLSIDRVQLKNWPGPKFCFGLWHRRTEGKFVHWETISWTDDINILTYLLRFPTELLEFARTIYCASQFEPLYTPID